MPYFNLTAGERTVRAQFLGDKNLIADPLAEFFHMRDNADQTMIAGETLQYPDRRLDRFGIQRAESFIDKHRIDFNTGLTLYFITQTERQRKRCQEGFTA